MRAFIIRPFGTKNDINFDEVEQELIDPALNELGVTGRTTDGDRRRRATSAWTCSSGC